MRNKLVSPFIASIVAVVLAGCAAAVPGYSPPKASLSETKPKDILRKPFESGAVSAAGHYQPSESEQKLDCRKLTGSMHVIMRRLDDASNKPVQSASSKAVQDLVAPTAAGKAPLSVSEEVGREKARLRAYNQLLAAKKCPTVDIARYQ